MPRKMTAQEFQQRYGMSVEDWLNSQQQQQQQQQQQPDRKKDFYSDPAIRSAVSKAVVAKPATQEEEDDWQPASAKYGSNSPLMPDPIERFMSNATAGVVALPAAVPSLAGLAKIGSKAAYDYFSSDDETLTAGKAFTDRFIKPEDQEALEKQIALAVLMYKKENPDATPEQLEKFQKDYIDSDEFYDAVSSKMPAEFRIARNIQDFANDLTGVGKRSDQMTAGDEVSQVIGSAFVGLPAKTVSAIGKGMTRLVGEKVASNLATKIAARTAEALTPVTLPLSPSNIALNAAAGSALTEGTRYLQGEDTLFDYDGLFDKVSSSPSVSAAAILGVSAVSPAAIGRVVKKNAENATEDVVRNIGNKLYEGRPLSEQDPDALQPQLNATVGTVDEISQATHAAHKFGATADDLDDIEIAATAGSYHQRKEIENRIQSYGELDPGYKTIPLQDIERAFSSLPQQDREAATNYLFAISRQQDEKLQLNSIMRDIERELAQLASADALGNSAAKHQHSMRLRKLQEDYQAIRADTEESRPSLTQWSRSEVDALVRAGNADPRFQKIRQAVQKYSDDLLKYAQRHGVVSADDFKTLREGRPLYFPLRQMEAAEYLGKGGNTLRRRAVLFANRAKRAFAGSEPLDDAPDTLNKVGRDLSVRSKGKVELPKDVVSSLRQMTSDIVHQVQTNEARKGMMAVFDRLPGAQGKLYRYHDFGGGKTSISQKQYEAIKHNSNIDESKYVRINDGDKVRLVEFADEGMKNLMKFQPNATVPVLNGMRRFFQEMTTGLGRPAFAVTQAFREPWLAAAEKGTDRSFGLLNTFTKKYAEGTILDQLTDAFDPTRAISGLSHIPVQLWSRSVKAMASKIESDLVHNSGIFNALFQSPGGREYVRNIANRMALAQEQSAYGLMSRRMGASFGYMSDINRITDDFARGAASSTGALRTTYNMYKALLESIHTSTRVAFWSQNLGVLAHKYGGVSKIPERELKRLELDTRKIGGDIGRRSKSKNVQRIASTMPYANTIMQGNRHFLASAFPNWARKGANKAFGTNFLETRSNSFWPVMISSVLAPKLASMAVMSEWPEADDWWYHKVPTWQRPIVLPLPTIEAIRTRVQTGKWPEGDPSEYFHKIPLPPDFIPIIMPFEAGLRATGIFGNDVKELPPVIEQMKEFGKEFAGLPAPPALNIAVMAMGGGSDRPGFPLGGANSDKVSPDNSMSQAMYDVIATIGGTGIKNLVDALNVGELALKDGQSIAESLGRVLSTYADNERQGLPEVGVPLLYQAQERKYAMTPDAEYVYKTERELKPVFDQLTRERDTKGKAAAVEAMGGRVGRTLKDPRLKALSEFVYDTLNKKGDYKAANDEYSLYRTALAGLQRQRMSPSEYNRVKSRLTKQQQIIRSTQARILRDTEQQLREAVGDGFKQMYGTDFSYSALAELVRKDQTQ